MIEQLRKGLSQKSFLPILLIIAGAFFFRIYGIGFGLPFSYHFDETTYSGAALNLGRLQIGPQINPTGFTNILFGEYAAYYLFGKLTGIFSSLSSFEQLYRSNPSAFLLLARLVSVIGGTLNVLVVYLIGKNIFNKFTGSLAALFLAVAFLHVRDSHFAVPDIFVTFVISLTILFCTLSIKKRNINYLYLAAGVAGFTIAVKWNTFLIILPLALSFVLFYKNAANQQVEGTTKGKKPVIISILFFIGAFLFGGFQLIIKPRLYIDYFLTELRSGSLGGFYYWQVDTLPGWLFYIKTLYYGLGVILLGFAILGVIYYIALAVKKRRLDLEMILLAFPVAYFLIMGATYHYFARYTLPLIPFAILFGAAIIYIIYDKLEARKPRLGIVFTSIFTLVIVLPSIVSDLRLDQLLTQIDTRTLAKDWIETNIPAGSKIAMDWPVYGPYLSTPEKVAPDSTREYEVTTFLDGYGLSDNPLSWYKDHGYQYLIASSFIYDIPLVDKVWDARRKEFYINLDKDLELVAEYTPYQGNSQPTFIFDEVYGPMVSLWQRERPGPTIKIYKLESNRSN